MKKMFKVIATVAAILSMANFVACKSDDDDDDSTVAVTSVTLDQTEASIAVGASVTLTATVTPTDATNKTVTWTSSDTTIATVKDGTVTGVKAGTATITAAAGGKSAEATITVTAASTDSGSTDTDGSSTDTDGSGDSSSDTTNTGFTVDLTDTSSTSELYTALSKLELKGSLTAGTYDGITITGTATRGNDSSKVVLEVKGSISFDVKSGAKIIIKAGSTSSSNTSEYTVSGAGITAEGSVTGTSYNPIEWTATEDGTFTLTTGTARGVRFTVISVEY